MNDQSVAAPHVADGKVNQSIQAFSFGDPTPVLGGRAVFDYLECWFNGRWYEPPLSLDGLSRAVGSSVHLHSGLTFKRNLLSKTFIPHRLLSRAAFEQFALDFLSLGNGYIEARRSMLGSTFQLKPATVPVWWCARHRWCPVASSVYWNATSSGAWTSQHRRRLSKASATATG